MAFVNAPDTEPDAVLDAVGAAFSRLRQRTTRSMTDRGVAKRDISRNLVINIVDEARGEMTVGAVAEQLSVDPSVASRMVSDCIDSGYLARSASQDDGRRIVIQLTSSGMALRDRFRRLQRQTFERITRDWADAERLEFARLLIKYSEAASGFTDRENEPADEPA
jgi:DNA-binding MarR family transcriptional regulator